MEQDNIKVAVRIRPLNQHDCEANKMAKCIHFVPGCHSITVSNNKTFSFDFVGDEEITQDRIFENIGKPIVESCLSGYNGTILAYGQTGSGKTYTIVGTESSYGLLPRSLYFQISSIQQSMKKHSNVEFHMKISVLEIYNEVINDLIETKQTNMHLRECPKAGVYVEGLHYETILTIEEAFSVIQQAIEQRHIGETLMNKQSSRSHAVFTLHIERKEKQGDLWNFKSSRFHLIDLAGSERLKATGAIGGRAKEAGNINRSLSALGIVINSLVEVAEGKSRYIHYRDSKLTFLLKDSLGGNAKTAVIATISPGSNSEGETLSTLRFAERAKQVRNRAIVNEDTVGTVRQLKEEVNSLKARLAGLRDTACEFEYLRDIELAASLKDEEIADLRREAEEKNGLLTHYESRTYELENELSKYCEELQTQHSSLAQIKEENQNARESYHLLTWKLNECAQSLGLKDLHIAELNEKLNCLETNYQALYKDSQLKSTQLFCQFEQSQTNETQLHKETLRLKELTLKQDTELARLRTEVSKLSAQNTQLIGHSNVNQKIRHHERLKNEHNELKAAHHRQTQEHCKLKQNYKVLQAKLCYLQSGPHTSEHEFYMKHISSLESALSEYREILQSLSELLFLEDKENSPGALVETLQLKLRLIQSLQHEITQLQSSIS